MAKTTIQGEGGSCAITGFGCKLDTWSATLDFGGVDTTGFSDAGWGTIEGTLCGMAGSASGMIIFGTAPIHAALVAATADPAEAKIAKLDLVTTGTAGYSMPAVISNISISRPEDGKVAIAFDFVSNGRITPNT